VVEYPVDEVFRPLASGLRLRPEFKVLGTVVVPDAILVVHILKGFERATQD